MPTTSSGRGFTIPTVNSDGNVWGNELNAFIGQLDMTLAGSLTLQSSNGTNVTLSSSQAQNARIVVQGALASNFILTLPSSNYALGEYTVWNNSSAGGGGVQCGTTGGGSNILIPQGAQRQIYVDGINAMFADNQAMAATSPSGFVNKFRNPTMDVAQRGSYWGSSAPAIGWSPTALSSQGGGGSSIGGGYTLDGWKLNTSNTAGLTWVQNGGGPINGNALRMFAPNVTTLTLSQRIESMVAAQLAGTKTGTPAAITVQYTVYNNSGASITPQLASFFPGATDNWSGQTNDLVPTNLQSIPANTTATLAYTFIPSANITRGYQLDLMFANALSGVSSATGWIDVGQADVRSTPGIAVGLNNSPPNPEMRPISAESLWCYRYLYVPPVGSGFCNVQNSGAGACIGNAIVNFPTPMRLTSSGAFPIMPWYSHNPATGFASIAPSNNGSNNAAMAWNLYSPAGQGAGGLFFLTGGYITNEL